VFVRVQEVTSRADLEEVFRFRYRVYVEELRKPLPSADHDRRMVTDPMDDIARVLAAVDEDSGAIVGSVRTLFGVEHPFPDDLIQRLQLAPLIDALGVDKISHSGTFMVDPAYRGLTIASQLVMHMLYQGLQLDALVDICICELALVRPYYQLGYRPYAPPSRPHEAAGLRVPLIWTARDRQYLRDVESPFSHAVPTELDDHGEVARQLGQLYPRFRNPKVTPRRLREFWAAFAHSSPAIRAPSVFQDVDRAKVDALLGDLPTLHVAAGERLYRKGETEKGMGLLLSGKFGVTLEGDPEPFFFSVLVPGEICGEMAGYLGGGRSASLVALEDSEVLLLPENLVAKLERRDAAVGLRIRDNLAAILAWRLDAMNHRVVGLERGSPERLPLDPQPIAADLVDEVEFSGSYSISTLEDSLTELERLEKQAAIGQQLEAVWFKRLGFRDSGVFLDVGSGPGVTSCLLARTFPESRVFGVEPDRRLRRRAKSRAVQLGMGERCRFVEGFGHSIPLDDDSIDFAYARFLFQHLPDPEATLAELHRVVRPGGVVAMVDVDDEAVLIHPRPAGLGDFGRRVVEAQGALGGDRYIGRKLVGYLERAGFESARTEVVPLSSHAIPVGELLDIAFGFKTQLLRKAGLWTEQDDRLLAELDHVARQPGSWLYIPVFLGHGRVPSSE